MFQYKTDMIKYAVLSDRYHYCCRHAVINIQDSHFKQRHFNIQKENRFCDHHIKLALVSILKYLFFKFSKLQSIILILF